MRITLAPLVSLAGGPGAWKRQLIGPGLSVFLRSVPVLAAARALNLRCGIEEVNKKSICIVACFRIEFNSCSRRVELDRLLRVAHRIFLQHGHLPG